LYRLKDYKHCANNKISKAAQAKYDKHCLSLSKNEIEKKLNSGIPYVVRLNVQPNQKIIFNDIVRDVCYFRQQQR
jgi:glutamyl/glutaminyl-tRNA synthetase